MPLGVEGGIFPAIIGSILLGLLTASMAALNMGLSPSYIWVHMVIPSTMRDGLSAIALGRPMRWGLPHRLCTLAPYYIRGPYRI